MISFDEAMILTGKVSSATALDDQECFALWQTMLKLEPLSIVVEIGCQLGRSSSMILQAAKEMKFRVSFIDPWTSQPDYMREWMEMAHSLEVPFTVHMMRTDQARTRAQWTGIDLLFIDGDHTAHGVTTDLNCMAPLVRNGGWLVMHDYGRDSLPDVKEQARKYFAQSRVGQWKPEGVWGTLAVWRRMQ